MISAPWSQNYITLTLRTKKRMAISVQRMSWTPLFKFSTLCIVKVPYSLYDIPPAWKKVITEPYSHRKVWTKWRKLFATSLSQPQQTEDATIFQPNLPTLYLQFNWTKNQAIHQEFHFRKKFLPAINASPFIFFF